ncbi:MAG: FecR domain-containing protein, partial [Pseudomonadota bacterium]
MTGSSIKAAKKSIALAALLASSTALAGPSGWTVSEATGSVTVNRDGRVLTVGKNKRLNEGDVILTGKGSRAVLVRQKEYVVVKPGARLKIADPEKDGPVTQFFQYIGNALFKVEKKSTPHFGVETPYMAAVVKGTTFNVAVSQEGTS